MFGSLPGDGAAPVEASEGFSALRSTTVASGSLPLKSLRRNAKKTSAATMIKSKTFDIQASYLMPSIDDATARPTTCREHRAGFFAVSLGWPPDLYGFHTAATAISGKRFRQSFKMPMQTMPTATSNAVISSLLRAPILIRQTGCVNGSVWHCKEAIPKWLYFNESLVPPRHYAPRRNER